MEPGLYWDIFLVQFDKNISNCSMEPLHFSPRNISADKTRHREKSDSQSRVVQTRKYFVYTINITRSTKSRSREIFWLETTDQVHDLIKIIKLIIFTRGIAPSLYDSFFFKLKKMEKTHKKNLIDGRAAIKITAVILAIRRFWYTSDPNRVVLWIRNTFWRLISKRLVNS